MEYSELPKLCKQHQAFANNLINGMKPKKAYEDVYDCSNMKPHTISVEAQKLKNNPKIKAYLEYAERNTNEVIKKKWEFDKDQAMERYDSVYKTLEGGVSVNVDENGNSLDMNNVPEVAYQSAMYKSPKENFSDFYNQVFEKENDAKANNTTVKKSYFQYNNNGLSVRIPHDTVIHDNNNHSLSSTEWETFLDNLQNPVDAVVSSEPRFNGTPILLKYKIGNSYYGAVIEFFNKKQPIIATAFIDKEENIDKWLKKNSHSQAKNTSSVTTKGMLLSNDYNNIISYVKQKLNPKEFANQNIEKNFGQSVEELQNNFTDDIKNILAENEIDYDEFEIEDVRLYGSYTTGKNKDSSDLDVIVQYKGSMKEDSAFNILNDTNLTITDVNGVERKVDINPINRELSGTIDERIERMHEIDSAYFQSANTAGVETSEEISDAQKEWQEKGTESKYFKKWFGDSKVVDENGKPLVVYHGSLWKFDTFGKSDEFDFSFSPKFAHEYAAQKSFEQALDLSPVLYSVYLKAENPFDFRDEKSVNELLKKIGDKEINFWGNKYSHEQFKDLIMGLSYENTVKNQEVFDKAERGMAYSRYNEDVEETMSSVADAKIVYKNKDYFVALDEIDEPRRSPFSSEPAGRVDRDDVYKQVEKLAKDIDFADEYIKKITLNTNLVKTTYEVGKGYVNEYTPYELTVRLRKVDNPKIAKKGSGYDNWSFFETTKIGDTYFLDFLKENGYDSYYKQEKEQLNISVFNPEQIKSVDNRGTFDENNPNIYYQSAYHGTPHRFDKFSTEHIGSGEGAQAHGWGLYFASDKNVSEEYRKQLSQDTWKYKGKELKAGEILYFKDLLENGKQNRLNFLKANAERVEREIKKEQENKKLYGIIINEREYNENVNQLKYVKEQIKIVKKIDISKIEHIKDTGQLFEVDIPESDVLLDEDELLSEQNKNIQKIVNHIIEEEKLDFSGFDPKGKDLYKALSKKYGSDKKASELLNYVYGIKGITYDGRQDGECYVVFDDKAVQVLNTFYQDKNDNILADEFSEKNKPVNLDGSEVQDVSNPLDYDYINNQVTGEKVSIEMNEDVNVEKIKPQKISSDLPFEISEKPSTNKKMLIESLNLNDKNSVELTNKYTQEKAVLNKGSIEKSLSNIKISNPAYNDFCTILYNSAVLFKNAQKIISHNDIKKDTDLKVKRYSNIAKVNDNEYLLEFVLKDNGQIMLYSVDIINRKAVSAKRLQGENLSAPDTANNSIAYIQDLFKSKLVKKYNKDYLKRNNRKISQNINLSNPLFQGADNSIDNLSYDEKKSLAELHEIAKAKHEGQEFLGYFTKTNDKNIIVVMENANASTIIHELAHCYLESLKDFAKTDKRIREKLDAIFDWLGVTDEDNISRDKHEKFARGFEAYVYNGVAPSKNMQTIFTEFKIWLQGVVDYWLNNDDGFKMDHEVKAVFDKIFDDTKNDVEKSEVQKLIDKANAISFNKNKLSDSQKRHKEYAYDIVAIATRKKKQYLKTILESNKNTDKIKKAKENIQFLCENCDDPFSGGNGFLPEWLEFFSDEGVSYGNQETGADAKLATKALNTIIDKTYSLQIDESEALTEINARYDFFLKEYKTKPENRNITFDAWVSWIDSLDEFEQCTYAEKFAYDIDYIERFEKLDKFEQAKETILNSAHDIYVSGASSFEQYKQTVMSVFDGLSFLTVADKARLTANILECRNEEFLKARIDSIMDIAKTMDDIHYRKSILSAIAKELQGTKNIKQNNKTVGKYDYRTNKIFELLRKYQGYSAEFANDVRLEREELIEKAENEGMTFEDKLINAFLQVKADGLTYANTSLIKQVYDDIIKLKIAGKNAKSELELMNKLNNKEASERVVKILENKEEGNVLEKFYVNTTANWESMLNTFFNKEIKDKYSLIADETRNSVWAFNEKRDFEEAVRKIYGLSKWNFDAEILKNLAETYEFKKNNYDRVTDEDGKPNYILRRVVPFKMNKMEIILAYMWNKNETLHQRMVNMFGEEQLIDMIDNLSPQDKQLGDLMMKTVNKYYAPANEVFIKKYGLDLPKVSAYFPSVAEREGSLSEIDLFKDFTQKSSSPSAIKNRSTSVYVPMKFANPVAMLYNHIDTMGRFIHMTESVDKINKVFNTSDIKDFIKNKYGEQAQKEFLQQLVNITYKQNATMRTKQMDIVNEMVSHWTSGNIIGKVSTGIKQLFACLNYSTAMPVDIWTKYFVKALMSPKQTIDYMYNKIGYLQYRYESGSQNEALQQFINNNPVEKWLYQKLERFTKDAKIKNLLKMSTITAPRKIREVLSIFLRLGDMGAIIFGGKPYIDYLINEKGLTEKEALTEFVVETQRTQQSAEISTLSNWQVVASSNPFSKLFMNYKNAQGQFIRKIADSMISFKRGEIDKTQLAKDVFMYGFLQPFLFKVGTSLSILTLLNTGDYDDLLDDIKTSIFDNLSFFHVFGDIGVGIINRFLTGTSYITTSALFGDIVKEILRCCKEDSDIEDFVHALGFFVQAKTGIPANSLVNEIQGLGDIASGDFQKGLIRALGWTEHRAEKVTGE